MTLTARVVCLPLTTPGAKVTTTMPLRSCVMRHLKKNEGLSKHTPKYPVCAACAEGRVRAKALEGMDLLPTPQELGQKFRPDHAQQKAARAKWMRTNLAVEYSAPREAGPSEAA